jgi:ABC-type multidrug transport system ATPase subunit
MVRSRVAIVPVPVSAAARAPAPPAILAVDVRQSIAEASLLRGVSFVAHGGELVAILGPSGAGKSVLLELLSGASRPTAGSVAVLGQTPGDPGLRGRVGYVPQTDAANDLLTVREALLATVALRAPLLSAREVALETEIARTLTRLGLAARADTRIRKLSGGERRRARLAIELCTDPDVLILDEVTSGLDVGAERRVVSLLAGIAAAGKCVICTTHTLECAGAFDRILVLHGGRIVFDGAPEAALQRFGLTRIQELYDRLAERPPHEWASDGTAASGFRLQAAGGCSERSS